MKPTRRELLLMLAAALAAGCVRRAPVRVGISRTGLVPVEGEALPGILRIPVPDAEAALRRARAAIAELPPVWSGRPLPVALYRVADRWRAIDRTGTLLPNPVEPARDAPRLIWESLPDGTRWDGETLRPLREARVPPLRELMLEERDGHLLIYRPDSPSFF